MSKIRVSHANRGVTLERMIEISNAQYRNRGLAVVHKVPTSWKILGNWGRELVKAWPEQKAIVDFVGCVASTGRMLAFDAKQNRNPKNFPFDRRWEHEVEFLADVTRCGGIGFMLIEQTDLEDSGVTGRLREVQRIYLLGAGHLFVMWEQAFRFNGRKSIPIDLLRTLPVVPSSTAVPVDYLAALKADGHTF